MNLRTEIATEEKPAPAVGQVSLPMGILGFEHMQRCLLIADPEEEPFRRLQAQEDPTINFLVIEPFYVVRDYQPNLPEPDVHFLGLQSPADAQLYNIVTIRGPGQVTINLKGPVVFNRNTMVGKQVIIDNAADYSVQHPLQVVE
jgi:flagellar assembly factor FliW